MINKILNIKKLFKIRLLTVNHLGKNPKNGGKPPKDIKFIIKRNLNILFKFNVLLNCFK